jgi:pimeloyl-ACP methyl ester carboxylesterase
MATFLLVHGAWAGGAVWRELTPRLRQAGHEVYAPTLTGIGARKHLLSPTVDLDTHIADILGVIDDEDLSDLVLVGHSYGGMVITGVADRVPDKIASLVYLDAFVPGHGQSASDLLPPDIRLATIADREWLVAPPPAARFGVTRPEVANLWSAKASPQPTACFMQPVSLSGGIDRVGRKTYIYASDPEPTTFTQFYRALRDEPGWAVHALPNNHFLQLEMPDELAAILLGSVPI